MDVTNHTNELATPQARMKNLLRIGTLGSQADLEQLFQKAVPAHTQIALAKVHVIKSEQFMANRDYVETVRAELENRSRGMMETTLTEEESANLRLSHPDVILHKGNIECREGSSPLVCIHEILRHFYIAERNDSKAWKEFNWSDAEEWPASPEAIGTHQLVANLMRITLIKHYQNTEGTASAAQGDQELIDGWLDSTKDPKNLDVWGSTSTDMPLPNNLKTFFTPLDSRDSSPVSK